MLKLPLPLRRSYRHFKFVFPPLTSSSSDILDPRKPEVAFTTASCEGEEAMRRQCVAEECKIPAAAFADDKCVISSNFIQGNAYNNNN